MTAVNDADVLESWEDVDESQLERVWNRAVAGSNTSSTPTTTTASKTSTSAMPGINTMTGMEGMTGIGGPTGASPGFRILKRPSANERAAAADSAEARSRPVKSLEQRQQDYEAARLRIMGQAKCPDDTQNMTSNLQIKTDNNRLLNVNKVKDKHAEQIPPSVPQNIVSVQPRIVNQNSTNGISLLRSPKGPDNSKGFNLKR